MPSLKELHEQGQSVWLDYLSRDLIRAGGLRALIERGVSGVTSNPTIFEKALAEGSAYDEQLRQLADLTPVEAFWRLAVRDVQDACDVLRPVFTESKEADGFVSLEVAPSLAYDANATEAAALELAALVERPNLYVKIPATIPGVKAIEEVIAQGQSVNVTLIFSLERYRAVVAAYLAGLERYRAAGGDLRRVHSVASFFVSRVDSEADRRLLEAGRADLKGKLAIANAKLAYQHYLDVVGSERWQALEKVGANRQWCLWASTSAKDPSYRDTLYVEELVGPETVDTMPLETIMAFEDHGRVLGASVLEGIDAARRDFATVSEIADYDDVVLVLEREGVEKFSHSFDSLLATLAKQLAKAPATA